MASHAGSGSQPSAKKITGEPATVETQGQNHTSTNKIKPGRSRKGAVAAHAPVTEIGAESKHSVDSKRTIDSNPDTKSKKIVDRPHSTAHSAETKLGEHGQHGADKKSHLQHHDHGQNDHDHGASKPRRGKKEKASKHPSSLKEALRHKHNPMGEEAGTHGHGLEHGVGHLEGDPSHPHHGKHPHKKKHHKHEHEHEDGHAHHHHHHEHEHHRKHRKHHHHHRKEHAFEGHVNQEEGIDIYEVSTLAKRQVRAFLPLRVLLSLAGRFPLTITRNERNGTYAYRCRWALPHGWFFLFSTALMLLISAVIITNYSMHRNKVILADRLRILKWTVGWTREKRMQVELSEFAVVDRHFTIVIILACGLLNGIIASFDIIRKRRFFVRYFMCWTEATEKLYMDVGQGMLGYSFILCSLFVLFIASLVILYALNVGSTARGGPTVIGFLLFRPYPPDLFYMETGKLTENPRDKTYRRTGLNPFHRILPYYKAIGCLVMILTFLWSKALLLIFLFKCRLLVNAFGIWNGRVYATVLRGREYNQTEDGRAAYKILFKDHCVLLDMLEGTDRFFSHMLESSFGLNIISLMAEMYFVLLYLRTAQDTRSERVAAEIQHYFVRRKLEWIIGCFIALQNIMFLYCVSNAAAEVGDEASAGLEVVRRKTMLGRKTDEELYFNFSMYYSYTSYKGCILRAAGYFDLNKDYMIGVFSVFLSYFIILQQFHPTFDLKDTSDLDGKAFQTRGRIGIFLHKLEELADCHWVNDKSLVKDKFDCPLKAPYR